MVVPLPTRSYINKELFTPLYARLTLQSRFICFDRMWHNHPRCIIQSSPFYCVETVMSVLTAAAHASSTRPTVWMLNAPIKTLLTRWSLCSLALTGLYLLRYTFVYGHPVCLVVHAGKVIQFSQSLSFVCVMVYLFTFFFSLTVAANTKGL